MSSKISLTAAAAKNEPGLDVEVDAELFKYLPEGSKLVSAKSHKGTLFTEPTKITVKLADESIKAYSLKLAEGDVGRSMLEGEFKGVKAIHTVAPKLVPQPIACGAYTSTPSTYFYLAEFVSVTGKAPEPPVLGAALAKLHKESVPKPPNGKFGFHVTTYAGKVSQDVTWCDTWEESYSQALRGVAKQENKVQGPSEELDQLLPTLYDRVIPRLLRPLSTEGRAINPVLVHGNLWLGNIGMNADTGSPVLFDTAVWWAHNEYELAHSNLSRYAIGKKSMEEYHKDYPISEPKADYEDRNRLYAIYGRFCTSTLSPKDIKYREYAIEDIKYLVDQYAGEVDTSP